MTKDLKKMAGNGYGHYLRRSITETEQNLKRWKFQIEEYKRSIKSNEDLINRHSEYLEEYKEDLKVIDAEYTHLEPDWSKDND